MKNLDLLPPIIKDIIENLNNDKSPVHVRDAYCARLENIVNCSNEAIERFRRKQTKHYTIQKKQKA